MPKTRLRNKDAAKATSKNTKPHLVTENPVLFKTKAQAGRKASRKNKSPIDTEKTTGDIDDVIISLQGKSKPSFTLAAPTASISLHDRLRSFLPELAQSNEGLMDLDKSMENVEEDEPHIVMDLGLGVLEQISTDVSDSGSSDSDVQSGNNDSASKTNDDDAMSVLLGEPRETERVGIEELG